MIHLTPLQHPEHAYLEPSVFMEVDHEDTVGVLWLNFVYLYIEGSVLDPSVNTSNEAFDPWGRPGAGAPIKNNSGQIVAATQNHFNDKKQVTGILELKKCFKYYHVL